MREKTQKKALEISALKTDKQGGPSYSQATEGPQSQGHRAGAGVHPDSFLCCCSQLSFEANRDCQVSAVGCRCTPLKALRMDPKINPCLEKATSWVRCLDD